MKKWIALFLALVLSLLCCPVVLAESDAADEDHRISQTAAPELPALKTVLPESEYTTASAPALEEQAVQWQTVKVDGWVNPLYADVLSVEDLTAPAGRRPLKSIRSYGEINYEENLHKIAMNLRQSMVNRGSTFCFRYACPTEKAPTGDNGLNELLHTLMTWALEITTAGWEGDYIAYQLGGYGPASCSIASGDGWSYYQMDLPISYYTTEDQEAQVSTEISQVISSLGINKNTPQYVKIRKIYDYVIENVKYDYANLNDNSYKLKYTAYAALINRTAVCQGYANLIYRLMWECGVPCRICDGTGGGGAHAWNLVALGKTFYYLDATWDAGKDPQSTLNYFLIGSTKLSADHTHQTAGNWISFEGYPISAENYNASALSAADLLPCTHSDYEMSFTINNPDGSVVFYYICPLCGCMDSMTAHGFSPEDDFNGNKAIDSGDLLLLACHVAKISVLPDVPSGKNAQDIVAFARMLIARDVQ